MPITGRLDCLCMWCGFFILMKGKKSFILYCDLIHTFNELSNEEAGELIKHIFSYVNDEDPITDNKLIKIAFEPIKQQLKRDLKYWESQIEQRRQAGLKSAESRKQLSTTVNDRSISSTDNVTVTVNDNVNETEDKRKRKVFTPPTLDEIKTYFKDSGYTEQSAEKAYNYYSVANWVDSKGNKIKNWKQKMQGVWFKDENKQKESKPLYDPTQPAPQPSGSILQ